MEHSFGERLASRSDAPASGRRVPRRAIPVLCLIAVSLILFTACTGAVSGERGWSAPTIDNDVLYVGSRSGELFAIPINRDLRDLTESATDPPKLRDNELDYLWKFPRDSQGDLLDDVQAIYSQPIVVGDMVYIAINRVAERIGEVGTIYALTFDEEEDTGNRRERSRVVEVWSQEYNAQGRIFGGLTYDEGTLYFADDQGYIYALDADSGDTRWTPRKISDERFWSTPAVADGVIYIGGMDHKLYALDAETGSSVWQAPFEADGAIASRPLVVGDTVYVGAFDRKFYAIDKATGEAWASIEGDNWFWNDAIFYEETIFVGTLGEEFYALRPDDLSIVWRYPREGLEGQRDFFGPVRSRSVAAGERIFVATREGLVRAFDVRTGEPVGRPQSSNKKILASLAIDGARIYIHDFDDRLQSMDFRRAE